MLPDLDTLRLAATSCSRDAVKAIRAYVDALAAHQKQGTPEGTSASLAIIDAVMSAQAMVHAVHHSLGIAVPVSAKIDRGDLRQDKQPG